ncbi:MAG: hypothetical protein Q8R57_06645, partial [Bacteroidota bacterium]|nr:hypothetical protein [Bacteroidota bacterium]
MQFQSDYPYLLLIVSALLASGVSYWLYRNNPLNLAKKWMVYGIMGLRWFSLFFICFLLLEPMIKWITQQKEKPLLVLAIDNSESMVAGKNANYLRNDFLNELQAFKSDLSSQFNLVQYTIGSGIAISDSLNFNEKLSNLSEGLTELENRNYQLNHAATILISDGMYNAGSNPAYALSKASAPVFT